MKKLITLTALLLAPLAALHAAEPVRLTKNAATGGFDFDTPVMSGSIVTEGAYHGITQLVDKQSGKQANDTRYSVLNLFKLMAVNLGMGTPRLTKREVTATGYDGGDFLARDGGPPGRDNRALHGERAGND